VNARYLLPLPHFSRHRKDKNMLRHVIAATVITSTSLVTLGVGTHALRAAQAEEATITGCLQAGATEGEFVLVADDKNTHQVQAGESIELAPHTNHRVELTGTVEKSDTSSILRVKALKMVASSCEG
jgi:predicted transcriptional regulator